MNQESIKRESDLLEEIGQLNKKLNICKQGLDQIIKHESGLSSQIAKTTLKELDK